MRLRMALGLGIAIIILQAFAPLVWQAVEQLVLNMLAILTDAVGSTATVLQGLPVSH